MRRSSAKLPSVTRRRTSSHSRNWALRMDGSPAVLAARRLSLALRDFGVAADVVDGHGLALVSVGCDPRVIVWCEFGPDGWRFRWWSGRVSAVTGYWVWDVCPLGAGQTAARRIVERVEQRSPDQPEPQAHGWAHIVLA